MKIKLFLIFFLLTPFLIAHGASTDVTVPELCKDIEKSYKGFHWDSSHCFDVNWHIGGTSVQGRPLIYAEFGNPDSKNVSLILSSVHGDEITPVYLGMELARYIQTHLGKYSDAHIILAPLVNPDGFFGKPRTRMNARGVDCNRNFLTVDWKAAALRAWKGKYKSDPRRFPGSAARSEPETIYQEYLITRFKPQKILSIHSPLNHVDYDGPTPLSLDKFGKDYITECLKLRKKLRATSTGFFPGSLGNFAGQELGIPTLTLELPSANPKKARQYWLTFSNGIDTMINYRLPQ